VAIFYVSASLTVFVGSNRFLRKLKSDSKEAQTQFKLASGTFIDVAVL
jgi:hypothetical protein